MSVEYTGLPEPVQMFIAHLSYEKGFSEATVAAYAKDLEQCQEFLVSRRMSLAEPERIEKRHVLD